VYPRPDGKFKRTKDLNGGSRKPYLVVHAREFAVARPPRLSRMGQDLGSWILAVTLAHPARRHPKLRSAAGTDLPFALQRKHRFGFPSPMDLRLDPAAWLPIAVFRAAHVLRFRRILGHDGTAS